MDRFGPTGKVSKNWSTFWGGPLFPVGPVWILVEWIAPSVLPEQFQTAAAVLASDWCQKTFVFFCPIKGQQTLGVISCVLTRKEHEVQLFAMFILAVRGGLSAIISPINQRMTFRRYHNSSLFKSLRKYSLIHLCKLILHWMHRYILSLNFWKAFRRGFPES